MFKLVSVCAALCVGFACGLTAADAVPVKTLENLQKAFADTANAKAQHEAFAAKADEEGYKSVAVLFRASAKAESIHLGKYETLIKSMNATAKSEAAKVEVKTTKENLMTALKAVNGNSAVLGDYVKQGGVDKSDKAVMFFTGTREDQASRAKLYRQAVDELDNWKAAGKEFLVCTVCGYTTGDLAVKLCSTCTSPREKFESFK